ncbi:MAG: Wzz/FepE/Etk N-terminal domain-containing protein [Pseudomonadota bacterium]|jgi:chain length determinant protein (polysaccharide antigen chain regulator)|nr:Wzz/FepE/Etk N-terminal domain-containing protein [Pseudomonadota bacterium]
MAEQPVSVSHDDDIDIFDLVDDIKDKWYWMLGTMVAGVLLAFVYAFTATPEFKTDAIITDVSPSELLPFNQPVLMSTLALSVNSGRDSDSPVMMMDVPVFELDTEGAFLGARSVLRSASVRRSFYSKLLLRGDDRITSLVSEDNLTEEQNLAKFLERFAFEDASGKETLDTYLKVSFSLPEDAELARDILNEYLIYATTEHQARVRNEFERKLQAQIDLNETRAANFRTHYETAKARRIAVLEEAASVAASINQSKPFYNTNDVVVSSEPPLYMMGEVALKREAEQLKARSSRESEDIFINGLPMITGYLDSLRAVKVDWESVQLVEVDQPALLPLKPAKPRKLLVVALGGISGVMMGILAALLAAASSRHLRRSERYKKVNSVL